MSGFLIIPTGGGGGSLGGDASGTTTNVTVTKIQGNAISTITPTDGQVLTWDASSSQWKPQQPISSLGSDGYGNYTCVSSAIVGNVVYLSSASTVGLANATDATKLAIGIVLSKSSSTQCVVQLEGENSSFSGLSVGAIYYLGLVDGTMTTTAPTTGGNVVQKIGFAKNSTTLVIEIDEDFIQL
jgi:hypothetical protein